MSIKDTYTQFSIAAVYRSFLYFTVQSDLVNVMVVVGKKKEMLVQ